MITKEHRLAEIGAIIRMRNSPEKLQAIAGFWMSDPINGARNRRTMVDMRKDVERLRELSLNKYAKSSDPNSAIRHAISLPVALNTVIKSFMPDFLDGEDSQSDLIMARKAFPQFCVGEKY